MLMKKLAGKKQYFDSGDYNMQKEKVKGPAVPNPLAAKNPSKIKGLIIQNHTESTTKKYPSALIAVLLYLIIF